MLRTKFFLSLAVAISTFCLCDAAYQDALDAIKLNNSFTLDQILPGDENILKQVDKQGNTLLHHYMMNYRENITKLLICSLMHKDSVNALNTNGDAPIHILVKKDHISLVWFFLNTMKVPVNVRLKNGENKTPLMLAAEQGNSKMAQELKLAVSSSENSNVLFSSSSSSSDKTHALNITIDGYDNHTDTNEDDKKVWVNLFSDVLTWPHPVSDSIISRIVQSGYPDFGIALFEYSDSLGLKMMNEAVTRKKFPFIFSLIKENDRACDYLDLHALWDLNSTADQQSVKSIIQKAIESVYTKLSTQDDAGDTIFHRLIRDGEIALAAKYVLSDEEYFSLRNVVNKNGKTLLGVAFEHNRFDFVEQTIDFLIKEEINLTSLSLDSFFTACSRAHDHDTKTRLTNIMEKLAVNHMITPYQVVQYIPASASIRPLLEKFLKKDHFDDNNELGKLMLVAASNKNSSEPLHVLRDIFGEQRFDQSVHTVVDTHGNTMIHLATQAKNIESLKMLTHLVAQSAPERNKLLNQTKNFKGNVPHDMLAVSLKRDYGYTNDQAAQHDFTQDLEKVKELDIYLRSIGSKGFSDTITFGSQAQSLDQVINHLGQKYNHENAYQDVFLDENDHHKVSGEEHSSDTSEKASGKGVTQFIAGNKWKIMAVSGAAVAVGIIARKLFKKYYASKASRIEVVSPDKFNELVNKVRQALVTSIDEKDFQYSAGKILFGYSDQIISRVITKAREHHQEEKNQ